MDTKHENSPADIFGHVVLYNAILITLTSLELDSRYQLFESANSQELLDYAAQSIRRSYLSVLIGIIAVCCLMYSKFGTIGIIVGIIFTLCNIIWIYSGYYMSIKNAANKNNLNMPSFFF